LAYRYLLLQAHYRSQVEFKWQALSSARSGLRRLVERFSSAAGSAPDPELGAIARHHLSTFDAAISEDLNTADAMAVVFATGRDDRLSAPELTALAHEFDAVLGLGLSTLAPGDLDLKPSALSATDEQVSALMAQRESARSARDFALSDTLRQQLAELGAVVEDHPSGPSTWRWA
jgi:cysteinyl-tRNA synthetase